MKSRLKYLHDLGYRIVPAHEHVKARAPSGETVRIPMRKETKQ